jgi:maltooligosyltrehalose trehalohydrolase
MGERLTRLAAPEAVKALQALMLLSPQVPMLFMGEEWGAETPFLFFCDFAGPLADAVREGRRGEFAKFKAFADPAMRERIPDPLDPATMKRSRLDRAELERPAHAAWRAMVKELLAIRHARIVPGLDGMRPQARVERVGAAGFSIAWRLANGAELTLQANLGRAPQGGFPQVVGTVLWSSSGTDPQAGTRPAWSVTAALGSGR